VNRTGNAAALAALFRLTQVNQQHLVVAKLGDKLFGRQVLNVLPGVGHELRGGFWGGLHVARLVAGSNGPRAGKYSTRGTQVRGRTCAGQHTWFARQKYLILRKKARGFWPRMGRERKPTHDYGLCRERPSHARAEHLLRTPDPRHSAGGERAAEPA
jgi:hypothetical protein